MSLRLSQVTIVILANSHNPSILHPSFLESQGIVTDRAFDPAGVFTTPAVSRVLYGDGLEFTMQTDRLQVSATRIDLDQAKNSDLPALVTRFITVLPHVSYIAVGVNLAGVIPMEAPGAYIRDRFVVRDRASVEGLTLTAADVRLSFAARSGPVNVAISSGQAAGPVAQPIEGVHIDMNYHHDLGPNDKVAEALAHLERFPEMVSEFIHATRQLFGQEA